MIFYHGSKEKLEKLEPKQAQAKEGINVPQDELLNAIYLTPFYEFAVLCAARPKGLSSVNDEEKTIHFENPEMFDPNKEIFIYRFDSEKIPLENIQKVKDENGEYDEKQYAIVGIKELRPDFVEYKKAIEIEKYYKLTNWKQKESSKEIAQENNWKIR